MNGWTLDRPEALLLLPLLLVFAWLARRGPRAEVHATGALAIWKRAVPESAPERQRARRNLPPAAWAALLALACAWLALAGPRFESARPGAGPWTLVVDRSASMFLAPPDAGTGARRAAPDSATRYGRAIDAALVLCERAGVEPAARRWRTLAFDGVHESTGARPPEEWASARWRAGVAVPWERYDSPRHVWVTDGAPRASDGTRLAPLVAGLVQCGASAIPGPVGDGPERLVHWDGSKLLDAPAPRRHVELDPALGEPLADFTRAWASARGFDVADPTPRRDGDRARVALRVARAGADSAGEPREGRLRWESAAHGKPPRLGPLAARAYPSLDREGLVVFARLEPFADAPASGKAPGALPAIQLAPGEIEFALDRLDVAGADPAVFAVAFGELFDAAVSPRPEVVPFEERTASGPAESRAPAGGSSTAPRSAPLPAVLAGLAAALAAVAWWLSAGTRTRFAAPGPAHGAAQGPAPGASPGATPAATGTRIPSGAVRSGAASGSGVD